jgi:hypothetical protein
MKSPPLENSSVNVKLRLALMWVVVMFFYIYNDVFMLLRDVQSGAAKPGSSPNELTMLAYALVITPAALMPLVCVVTTPAILRWLNIVLGLAYFVIIVLTLVPESTAMFYRFIGIVENCITLVVVWTAWRWPRSTAAQIVPTSE